MSAENPSTVQELLSSPLYEEAFHKAMSGNEIMLSGEERDVLARAKELTGAYGSGYPMPARIDPTRDYNG